MGWKEMSAGVLSRCLATFGETVDYTPAGGALVAIRGIFDENHIAVDLETGAEVTSTSPVLSLRLADLPAAPAKDDTVQLRGRTFKVTDWHPDSEGGGKVVLREQ